VDLFIKLKILTNIDDKKSETHHCLPVSVRHPHHCSHRRRSNRRKENSHEVSIGEEEPEALRIWLLLL
jgi:hypothetical protein